MTNKILLEKYSAHFGLNINICFGQMDKASRLLPLASRVGKKGELNCTGNKLKRTQKNKLPKSY